MVFIYIKTISQINHHLVESASTTAIPYQYSVVTLFNKQSRNTLQTHTPNPTINSLFNCRNLPED